MHKRQFLTICIRSNANIFFANAGKQRQIRHPTSGLKTGRQKNQHTHNRIFKGQPDPSFEDFARISLRRGSGLSSSVGSE